MTTATGQPRDLEREARAALGTERATLADVAARAGVSRPTVSKVLNDRPNCWASDETRRRIWAAAAALGYRPNLSARALRSGLSHVVGFVSPGFQASLHSRPGGLTDAAAEADYTVTLSSHPNDSDSEDLVIRRLLDRGVDGLIVYPVDTGPHLELRRLVESGFPVITFEGANLLDFECDDVSSNFEEVGRLQAQHLLELDRNRICLIDTAPCARVNAICQDAVRRELARAGAPSPVEMHLHIPPESETPDADPLAAGTRTFLKQHRGAFNGIIGIDSLASLAVRVLLEQGLSIPGDVAVVGAGDGALASYGAVPLTSVSTSDDVAGATAFALLEERIRGRGGDAFQRVKSHTELIVRSSTERPERSET